MECKVIFVCSKISFMNAYFGAFELTACWASRFRNSQIGAKVHNTNVISILLFRLVSTATTFVQMEASTRYLRWKNWSVGR